jgi:alcohol dehydrogenase (cytochrome c)
MATAAKRLCVNAGGGGGGDEAQYFVVLDGRTGKPLWHFNVGQTVHASPMSYAVAGKQYFAVAAGTDLFSFALP